MACSSELYLFSSWGRLKLAIARSEYNNLGKMHFKRLMPWKLVRSEDAMAAPSNYTDVAETPRTLDVTRQTQHAGHILNSNTQ